MQCPFLTRRALPAPATNAGLATKAVAADEEPPGSDEKPQKGDLLVQSGGGLEGKLIKPRDLKPGGPPLHAWPQDPMTSVVRKGAILVIRHARVVLGPAGRLAALPLAVVGGSLTVAAPFIGKAGA